MSRYALASEDDARDNLDALVRRAGADLASLSRMLGRRNNYLRKWLGGLGRETLTDAERYALARHFDVDARLLGAPMRGAANE